MAKLVQDLQQRASRLLTGRGRAGAIIGQPRFQRLISDWANEHQLSEAEVEAQVADHLDEMLASHGESAMASWNKFGTWMMRAHDVVVDEDQLVALRKLDRQHSLALVFSHRSYLDGYALPAALGARRFGPIYTFGGANLNLPILGRLASQTGIIFIRRSMKDAPLYRRTLRGYISHLVATKANVAWSIEGGRTRTGKLRPPTYGILRYLADAVDAEPGPDAMLVPVSIVYDQLHEVGRMASEATGAAKRPEDFRWLINLARSQGERLGRVYLSFGTPIPLRGRMEELREGGLAPDHVVERIALEASHRINRVTPVTVTAVVCLALLGADRALPFERVLATVQPFAAYIDKRAWPVAGGANLTDRLTVRHALHELVTSGVLDCYDAGTEPVWRVAEDQHLVAAFYRNTLIHILVDRAIGEVALLAAVDAGPQANGMRVAWEHALDLRDLLKFEFFFPPRAEFDTELRTEMAIIAPGFHDDFDGAMAAQALESAPVYLAHLVLRPFIESYLVVADRLAAAADADLDEADCAALLTESLHLGQQWVLERRITSAESVSLELFRNALQLARHRGLVSSTDTPVVQDDDDLPRTGGRSTPAPDASGRERTLAEARAALRDELQAVSEQIRRIAVYADKRAGSLSAAAPAGGDHESR